MIDQTVNNAFAQFLQQPGRKHSTKAKYIYKFKQFLEEHGNKQISEITAVTIEKWFTHLKRKGYSDGHLAFHRSCHKTFWNSLGLNIVKIPRYAETPAAIITASDDEIHKLLATCKHMWSTIQQQRDAAIVALGTCGLRRSNIQHLRTSQASQALSNPLPSATGHHHYIIHTKGKQNMLAVLDQQRAEILKRYLQNRPPTRHARLFINLNPHSKNYLEPLSSEAYANARKNVCTTARLRLITFQQMRRWLGTKIAKTNNIQIAAHALGHKSGVSVILNHYYNPETETTKNAILNSYMT